MEEQSLDRCSVCGMPFQDTGKKQQCRRCGMFAHLCCDPQMPIEFGAASGAVPPPSARCVNIPTPCASAPSAKS